MKVQRQERIGRFKKKSSGCNILSNQEKDSRWDFRNRGSYHIGKLQPTTQIHSIVFHIVLELRMFFNVFKDCTKKHDKTMRYHYPPIRMAKILNTGNTKYWEGCGATGTFIHYWWEYKMVQPLWKTVRQFLTRLNIPLPYNPAIALLGFYPMELKTYVHTKTYMSVYSSFIYHCQNMKATMMSFIRWLDT